MSEITIVPRPEEIRGRQGRRPIRGEKAAVANALLDLATKNDPQAVFVAAATPKAQWQIKNSVWSYFRRYYPTEYYVHTKIADGGVIFWLTQRPEAPK